MTETNGAPHNEPEIRFVYMENGEVDGQPRLRAQAAAYAPGTGWLRGLTEAESGESYNTFIVGCREDGDAYCAQAAYNLVKLNRSLEGGEFTKEEVLGNAYMQTITGLTEMPVEVVFSLLACMLVGTAEHLADEPDILAKLEAESEGG